MDDPERPSAEEAKWRPESNGDNLCTTASLPPGPAPPGLSARRSRRTRSIVRAPDFERELPPTTVSPREAEVVIP